MTDVEKDLKAAQKKKRDIIITSILLMIFAISFTKNVLLRKKTAPPTAGASTNVAQSMSDQLVTVTNIRLYDKLRKERVKLWDREWARDPFVAQQAAAGLVKAVNLTLKGILWDEKIPKAIVNEKTLLKGDTIYGYTVMDIKPHSVILRTGEKNIELQVFRPIVGETAPVAN